MLKHYSWSAIQRFGTQIIGFLGNILIARQLSPDDYGLIAMLAIFMSIAMNFTESGFADYLIRKPNTSINEYSVVFVHNIIFAFLFYALLYVSAPWISAFFEREELILVTRILGLNIILKALSLSEFARMRKLLLFKSMAIIQIISVSLALVLGYTMALCGWGYWALVGQVLCTSLSTVVLIMLINKWWPKLYFNWSVYKKMRKFSNNMLVSYFTNQIGVNLYAVFIGKFHSSSILGFYNQAGKINKISFESLNGIVLTTSYAILAKEQDRIKRLRMYVDLLNHFLFLHLAISGLLIGLSTPLIGFVFGKQWLPASPLLVLILASFLLQPLVTINSNIVKIENRPEIYRNLTFLRNGLMFLGLLITYRYSIEIIIIGQIIAKVISAVVDVFVCGKYISFYPIKQFEIFIKHIIAPIVSLTLAYYSMIAINSSSYFSELLVFSSVYSVLFIVMNSLLKNSSFARIMEKIKGMRKENT